MLGEVLSTKPTAGGPHSYYKMKGWSDYQMFGSQLSIIIVCMTQRRTCKDKYDVNSKHKYDVNTYKK